jgi:hypothetical protein
MMPRLVTLLVALSFSPMIFASELHVGAPIQLSYPTEGPLPISVSESLVATDGSRYLVATAGAVTLFDNGGNVVVSRALSYPAFGTLVYVGWDGRQYVVFTAAVGDLQTSLRATRVSADGTIIDSRVLSRQLVGIPAIAFDGRNYAVAHGWVNVAYWNRELADRGIDVQVALMGGYKGPRAIASNGNGFTVAYAYAAEGGFELRSSVLDDDGHILATHVLDHGSHLSIRLFSNGRSMLLVYESGFYYDTYAVLLDETGNEMGTPAGVNVGWGLVSAVAGAADGYYLVITESQDTSFIVHLRDTLPLKFDTLTSNQPYFTASDAAATADRVLVLSPRLVDPAANGKWVLYGAFYALDGTELRHFTTAFRPITKVGAKDPVIGWGDGAYLAAWGETQWKNEEPVAGIAAQIVTPKGHPAGTVIHFAGTKPLRVAYGDGVFAVLAEGEEGIVVRRISTAGALLDDDPVVLLGTPPSCGEKQFEWDGAAFRLLYATCDTCYGADGKDLYSISLPASGPANAPELIRSVTAFSKLSAFACADEQCMIAWVEVQDVCGMEQHPTNSAMRLWGEFIDKRPIVLAETPRKPRLAAGGGVYLTLWNGDAIATGPNEFVVDVHAGIFDRSGVLVKGGPDGAPLMTLTNANALGVWDGKAFLVYAIDPTYSNRPTPIIRYDTNLNALDTQPTLAPQLRSIDSSRDGHSVGLTWILPEDSVGTVYAIPIEETSRARAISR